MSNTTPEDDIKQRPFNRDALSSFAVDLIKLRDTSGGISAFRFTTVVPIEEHIPKKKAKLTPVDEYTLLLMLRDHFGGCTKIPKSTGFGLRDPRAGSAEDRPVAELNYNVQFVVYACPVAEASQYFRVLQAELIEALGEGRILIEQQEVTLL